MPNFLSAPPPTRASPVTHKFVWSRPGLNLNSLAFLKSPQILRARFRCMTSFTSPGHTLSGIFILTSVNDTSSPRVRQHLCSSLLLTNPCAKRKVLSLTKPKGRIYKTKPLGHYITTSLQRTVSDHRLCTRASKHRVVTKGKSRRSKE